MLLQKFFSKVCLYLFIAFEFCIPIHASDAVPKSIQKMCYSLPDIHEFKINYSIPTGIKPIAPGCWTAIDPSNTASKAAEIEKYHKQIKQLTDIYDQIFPYMKPKVNILLFPGILAKGYLTYDSANGLYCLTLGAFDEIRRFGSQGVFGPQQVYFNDAGIITKREPIIYKH